MDRRRAAGVLLALAASVAYATAAPTASNHTSLDLYDGAPEGCYYNFQHYGEGDRIMTNEPCLNCTCHNRMLMCYLRVCPFTKPIGQDCTIEKRADQCCPIVTCPDVPVDLLTSTTTSPAEYGATGVGKLDKYGCSIHGKYFSEGSKVPPTPNKPCEHCYCIRNMTTCVMQECTLHVDGCTPIYHKDVCCPVRYSCDHPEDEMPLLDDLSTTVRPTPGFLLTTTTLSPVTQMSQDCLYENQIIPDGALIKTEKACDHCYCMKGDIVCVVQECGTPMENEGKNCTALAPREGVCCPDTYICEGDEPTTGTYDGLDYTTEFEKDIKTTSPPPRRSGSEGSGYRNEPDDIPNTGSPAFDSETEGSGDEQTTINISAITESLPGSHKIETADTISTSSEEPQEFIAVTTTKSPDSEYQDFTTESDTHKVTSETQQYIPSTTGTHIPQQSDESTTNAQDEDMGSGEEDFITKHEIVSTSSASPSIAENDQTISSEQDIRTTESDNKYEPHVKEPTTSVPIVDEYQTILPQEHSVATESHVKEPTTSVPIVDEDQTILPQEHSVATESHVKEPTTSVPIVDEDQTILPQEHSVDTESHVKEPTTSVPIVDEDQTILPQEDSVATESHVKEPTTSVPIVDEDQTIIPQEDSVATESHVKEPTTNVPIIDEDQTIIPQEHSVATESRVNEPTTSVPIVDEDQTILQQEQSVTDGSAVELTTESGHHLDKDENVKPTITIGESPVTEHISLQTTTSVPVMDEYESKTTVSDENNNIDISDDTDTTKTYDPQNYLTVTSAPGIEDEMTTIDSQDIDGTGADFDPHHQISVTASTPLLEEIEKDTDDQENIIEESTSDKYKTSTISLNIPTEETIDKDLKPEMLDEIIATNITTTDSAFENDYLTSAEPHVGQEAEFEHSSEPQPFSTSAHTIDYERKETTPSDIINISEPQYSQDKESSGPQKYSPTTSVPVFEDEIKETTASDSISNNEPQKNKETDVEDSSELQQHAPTTSATALDSELIKTTLLDSETTLEPQRSQETDVEESPGPQQFGSTSSAPITDDELESLTTSEPLRGQETDIDESSGTQLYSRTTIASSTFEDGIKRTTPSESITTSEPQKGQEIDVKDSTEPQQYATSTSISMPDDETKTSETSTTSESLSSQESDIEETSKPPLFAPTTSSDFEDESKVTSPDFVNVSEPQKSHEIDIEESSEPQKYSPTTSVPDLEDIHKTTISDATIYEDIDHHNRSSVSTFEQNDITTVEPDRGLNTIPSGSVDEETTETSDVEKSSLASETSEPAIELENKFSDQTGSITDTTKAIPDTSGSREDQFTLSTESTVKENIDSITSTVSHSILEETTVPLDTSEETISSLINDYSSSTKAPVSEYQETSSSPIYSNTDIYKQTENSKETIAYESTTQFIGPDDSSSKKHETITSSFTTTPESTTANLEENEIINEPRIPGEGDCLLNGVTYRNESVVPSTNKCQSGCRCSSSIIKCDPILCSPPPEYMEIQSNCQTTYDSLDSCCPTYVCDQKNETMLPQSHSQMSGTEAPVDSPVKCNGDECILIGDKKQPENIPVLCEPGSCSEDETISHPQKIPEQPTVDYHEGCTGDKCTSSETTDQLCSEDGGCQPPPLKPCEGTECEITLDTLPSHNQQPCADGDICDIPVKDCSSGKCDSESGSFEKKPHKKICENKEECEDKLDIEKECTEKSCKRKDDSLSEQQPPKKCSGSECQSTESTPDIELTTAASITTSQEEKEFEVETKPADKLDIVTEKVETSSELPSTDLYHTTRPIDDNTNETDLYKTTLSDVTTKLPEPDIKDEVSTTYESATPKDITVSPVTLPEITKADDDDVITETPTHLPEMYSTEKQNELITEPGDILNSDSSTVVPKESESDTSKIIDTDSQTTESPDNEVSDNATTSDLEIMFTKPPETHLTESFDASKPTEIEEATTKVSDVTSSVPIEPHDMDLQEITKSPTDSIDEKTTTKISVTDYEPQAVTKSPHESEDDAATTRITDEISSTPSKTYDLNSYEASNPTEATFSEDMITQTQELIKPKPSKPLDADVEEATEEPPSVQTRPESTEKVDSDEITTRFIENLITDSTKSYDSIEKEVTKSPELILYSEKTTIKEDRSTETSRPLGLEESVTISNHQPGTESSKPDESEPSEITKSPYDFVEENTKITKETETELPIVNDSKSQTVTQSESESTPSLDTTTTKTIEYEHKVPYESQSIEKSTTTQPETVPELTTQSIVVIDSKDTEPEKMDVNEITTGVQELSQPTESAIEESFDKATSISSISTEKDVIPISEQDILTETPIEFVTVSEPHSTVPSGKPFEQEETTTPEILLSIPDEDINDLSKEQDTQTPIDEKETSEASVSLDEITKKPDDDKLEEDVNTDVPNILQTDKDKVTTSMPIDTTNIAYEIDMKTEQPEMAVSPKEKLPSEAMDKTTENTSIAEKATTELTFDESKTKLPFESEIEKDSQTDKPVIRDQELLPAEPTKVDSSEKDVLETEAPFVDESVTIREQEPLPTETTKVDSSEIYESGTKAPVVDDLVTLSPGIEDKRTKLPMETVKETDTTQRPSIYAKPTESEEEAHTNIPSHGTPETDDTEVSHASDQNIDEKLTTAAIELSETTSEQSKTTESFGSPDIYTEKPTKTTQIESLKPGVTEQIEVESSSSRDETEDQSQTDIHELPTESIQETYTAVSGEKITTEGPMITETVENLDSVIETGEKITKEMETQTTTHQDDFEPSQSTTTVSADQVTKVQDQGNDESIDVSTSETDTKDSHETPSVLNTTETPETGLGEDIQKFPSEHEHTSTPKQEFLETTTTGKTEDESLSPVDTESSEIPVTLSDIHTVEIVTEPQSSPVDSVTSKQEIVTELIADELVTSKTARPEMYTSTVSAVEEFEKSTPPPINEEEASLIPDQTMLTSVKPNLSDEEPSVTTIVSDMDRASTPKSEIETQTEKVTTSTEESLQPEPSLETLAPNEEKVTTLKTEEMSTASPVFDKFTKPTIKPTKAPVTEQPKPIPTEEQPTDDFLPTDEEPSIPSSGTSGYGTDTDYPEEDQTFGPGTCRYGGKVYVSAQQIPRDDPCDFCFCFRSDIICLQQSCPPPIHGCHEEPISGFCCPRYECPVSMATTVNVTTTTTTTTTTLPPHFPVHSYKGSAQKRGCLIKGHTYKVGEVVRASSGPCLHCTCGGDGQMKCDPKQCTPEPMLRQMIAAAVSAKRRR